MKILLILMACIALPACVSVPNIYLIDRHTVMESEASGEWPALDKRFLKKSIAKGPVDLAKDPNDNRKKKAFRILNGEMESKSSVEMVNK